MLQNYKNTKVSGRGIHTTSSSNGAEPTGRDTSNVGHSGSVYLRSTKNGPQDVLDNHDVSSNGKKRFL